MIVNGQTTTMKKTGNCEFVISKGSFSTDPIKFFWIPPGFELCDKAETKEGKGLDISFNNNNQDLHFGPDY